MWNKLKSSNFISIIWKSIRKVKCDLRVSKSKSLKLKSLETPLRIRRNCKTKIWSSLLIYLSNRNFDSL